MKLDLNKIKKYQEFLEAMLEKSSKETVEKFTKEELSFLSKLIPGFDFQIADTDKRLKIIGAIEAAELLLDPKMQKKLAQADSWAEVDRMALNIMADRELGEYQKSKDEREKSKDEIKQPAPTEKKWHQDK